MVGKGGWRLAAWVLSAGLLLPAGVQAGWLHGCAKGQAPDCPPHLYSPWHYWTPGLYRIYAHCHGPKVTGCIPDRYPQIPIRAVIIPYPCQAVDPGALYGGGYGSR